MNGEQNKPVFITNIGFNTHELDIIETYQKFRGKGETRNEIIRKIISEWAEDRHLTLEVGRKNEKYKPTEDRLEELKQLRFLKAKYPEEK